MFFFDFVTYQKFFFQLRDLFLIALEPARCETLVFDFIILSFNIDRAGSACALVSLEQKGYFAKVYESWKNSKIQNTIPW